jgi:predicted fused transcriptional regulator/phosphomethylpyrimidine kinase
MQTFSSATYFTGHVGPFSVYPTAATSRDKLAVPKWRNNIAVQTPDAPDDNAVAAIHGTIADRHRAILLFSDHATFKAWQRKLAEVLA